MVSRRAESSGSDEVSCLRVSSLAPENCAKHTFCRFNNSLMGKGLSLDIGSASGHFSSRFVSNCHVIPLYPEQHSLKSWGCSC